MPLDSGQTCTTMEIGFYLLVYISWVWLELYCLALNNSPSSHLYIWFLCAKYCVIYILLDRIKSNQMMSFSISASWVAYPHQPFVYCIWLLNPFTASSKTSFFWLEQNITHKQQFRFPINGKHEVLNKQGSLCHLKERFNHIVSGVCTWTDNFSQRYFSL